MNFRLNSLTSSVSGLRTPGPAEVKQVPGKIFSGLINSLPDVVN